MTLLLIFVQNLKSYTYHEQPAFRQRHYM